MQMSQSQQSVQEFMRRKGLTLPEKPTTPDWKERVLCARLLLEETLETIEKGLGVLVSLRHPELGLLGYYFERLEFHSIFTENGDLVEIADGTADVRYVSYYIDNVCGVNSAPIDAEVCANNLAKFGEGSYIDGNGKLCKPADHKPPRVRELLLEQGAEGI